MKANNRVINFVVLAVSLTVDCSQFKDELFQLSGFVNITNFGKTDVINEIIIELPSIPTCASHCLSNPKCAIFDECRTPTKYICLLWKDDSSSSSLTLGENGNCGRYKKKIRCPDPHRYIYDKEHGCICKSLFYGLHCEYTYRDCEYIQATKGNISGLYSLKFQGNDFDVYCEMRYDGAWTKHIDNSVNFGLGWKQYENGFGNKRNWWLGLRKMHDLMRGDTYELRIDMVVRKRQARYVKYGEFTIGDAKDLYSLYVTDFSGNLADSLSYHNAQPFSTFDKDYDKSSNNCALFIGGGFWYNDCATVRLNGPYRKLYWSKNGKQRHPHFRLGKVSMKMKRSSKK